MPIDVVQCKISDSTLQRTQRLEELQESIGSNNVLALCFEKKQLDFRHALFNQFNFWNEFALAGKHDRHSNSHDATHFDVIVVV